MGRKKKNGINGFEEKVENVVSQLKELEVNDYFVLPTEIDGYEVAVGVWSVGSKGSYAIKLRRENSHPASYIAKIRNIDELQAIKKTIEFLEQNMHVVEAINRLNGNNVRKTKTPKGKILQF